MHDHLTGVMFRVSAVERADRTRSSTTTPGTTELGRGLAVGGVDRRRSGWSVEMRIPLSQLRFTSARPADLGHQRRAIHPPEERRTRGSRWCRRTRPASRRGWSHLTGLDGLQAARRIELLPYTAGRAEYVAPASSGAIRSTTVRAPFGVRRPRHEVRADQQPDASTRP